MFYYLDQAATTALYPEALKAMMPYLTEAYGNPSSQHPKGARKRPAPLLWHGNRQPAPYPSTRQKSPLRAAAAKATTRP